MKFVAFGGWLAALVCVNGRAADTSTTAQAPQSGDVQAFNQSLPSTMTCGQLKALLKAGDHVRCTRRENGQVTGAHWES
jgi:hypothetical protein